MKDRRGALALLCGCLLAYALTSYGGTRSPDSEVVVRTAESLARRGSFAVERELERWRGFGLATGRDGRLYSVFGPLEPLLLVPFVRLADALEPTGWYRRIPLPLSHYAGQGASHVLRGTRPEDLAPHAVRLFCAAFNVLVGALGVVAFRGLVLGITADPGASTALALLYALGTPQWSYAGTLFSEPLAALFVILSLRALLRAGRPGPGAPRGGALAGGLLGLAVTAHLSAVLFAPFFALLLALALRERGAPRRELAAALLAFSAGLGLFLALLGLHDLVRFGDPFETGRGVPHDPPVDTLYGRFTWPWEGLRGLCLSPGKGLFVYAPATAVGLALWPRFHRRHRALSVALGGAALFRLLFVASRTDWHGGWALGPRYLMLAVPLLLLPLGAWLREARARGSRRALVAALGFGLAAASQQLYFALGELFTAQRIARITASASGGSFDLIGDVGLTPLVTSLDSGPGPLLLGLVPGSNGVRWLLGTALLGAALARWGRRLLAAPAPPSTSRSSPDEPPV